MEGTRVINSAQDEYPNAFGSGMLRFKERTRTVRRSVGYVGELRVCRNEPVGRTSDSSGLPSS
eukprot:5397639-Amphidinium_carterae.3